MDFSTQNAKAVDLIYHAWITGLVLSLVTRQGNHIAEQFVFKLFRKQHLERFLPGLEKLKLTNEPHAVAAAKYHYFSNQLGGVKVEYFAESDRKAWVRYPPPRWIWEGTAICGIPNEVNRAMLRGWHGHNGVTLNNPKLGFVCTKTTAEGHAGLEGYYQEYDHNLSSEERLQFKPDQVCPRINTADMPILDAASWPEARKAKAACNYSMEYIRNALPILIELLGNDEALALGTICGRQVGMHCFDEVETLLNLPQANQGEDNTAQSFLYLLEDLLTASGDQVEVVEGTLGATLERTHWRLFPDQNDANRQVLEQIWLAPFQGLLAVHDRFLALNFSGGSFSLSPAPG